MNRYATLALAAVATHTACAQAPQSRGANDLHLHNPGGLQLLVPDRSQAVVRVVLPGHDASDRSIEVLLPEHVTAVKRGGSAEQLYMFGREPRTPAPRWRRVGQAVEYEREMSGNVRMIARAVLENDGVRFQYELSNGSDNALDMIVAVTDPRLTGVFHDRRLERTYVHHPDGFELLASETPDRLTMPLGRWLPARYLASFTWPVPRQPFETRADGITYYNKSRAVDVPLLATLSTDRNWVVASFARTTGNVWSNPELTCQHVDPQRALAPGERATLEVKMLVLRGTLEDVLRLATTQRLALQ